MTQDGGVFAGMASFGQRSHVLEQAVSSLIDQVDRLGVYLNGYSEVPDFLDHPKIEVVRSEDHGDIRDNGKFFFLDRGFRYYAAVDDDIQYPSDYIARLRACLDDVGPDAAVAVHGAIYPTQILGLFHPRYLFHYRDSLPHVMPVQLVGTGTVIFDQERWALSLDEFGEPGMADVWFAVAARKRSGPLFVVNRQKEWLRDAEFGSMDGAAPAQPRLFSEAFLSDEIQVGALTQAGISEGGFDGLIASVEGSERLLERMTISQALLFDTVRREVGYPSLSEPAAAKLIDGLHAVRTGWGEVPGWSTSDLEEYHRVIVGLLSGTLRSASAARALDGLGDSGGNRAKLPYPLRFDSGPKRLQRLSHGVLLRCVEEDPFGIEVVWPRLVAAGHTPLHVAVEAERQGVDTEFMDLQELENLGERNAKRAASWIYEYYEATDWSHVPEVLRWRMILRSGFEALGSQLMLGLAAARSGQIDYARRVVQGLRLSRPGHPETRLLEAAVEGLADPARSLPLALEAIDGILASANVRGFSQYRGDRGSLHWIDDLEPPRSDPDETTESPDVTVVMTTYQSAETVGAAIRSVLASTDVEFELIVVDDASTDGTVEIIESIRDGRMTLIRNDSNLGPYASRNVALGHASGRFIAIADADDWSHPQRLGLQVEYLDHHPEALACLVSHVRLRPDGNLDLENNLRFMGHGPMSLMFRREVLAEIGGFDTVRTRGDMEFLGRLRARFGGLVLARLDVPLVIATSSPWTNSKRFPREALDRYREGFAAWHLRNGRSEKLFVPLGERAPFVAPAELL